MKVIGVYSGRFQPFCPHHNKSFKWLQQQFGIDNTFIITSDKTNATDSPLSFNDKCIVMGLNGIKRSQIIQVANPYKPSELTSKFNPTDTAIVMMIGDKDASRISFTKKDGSESSMRPYTKETELEPFSVCSYVINAPHVSINLPGYGEMSGTTIRQWIQKSSPIDFKRVMGWFDPKIYNLLKKKVNLSESLLTEGGAAGHLSHIIEDDEMTFGDLKEIIKRSLSGNLDVEEQVTEKTDGINLLITFKDGRVLAARNKPTILNPVDINGLSELFTFKPEVNEAFKYAMTDLQMALANVDKETLQKLFKNGLVFANIEIIYPTANNTIDYGDTSFLQIHNLVEYDAEGNKVKTYPQAGQIVHNLIKRVNANVQSKFSIIPPNVLNLQTVSDYESKIQFYEKEISKLQNEFQLNDNDTINQYYLQWWLQFIKHKFKIVDNELVNGIARRWALDDKEFRLNGTMVQDKDLLSTLVKFESTQSKKAQLRLVERFESLLFKISVDVLEHVSNYLGASNSPEITKSIKNKLLNAIEDVKNNGNLNDVQRLRKMVAKINNAGGINKIIPSEGLVFTYKGKQYKLTGTFAPINQIIGMVKFRKN